MYATFDDDRIVSLTMGIIKSYPITDAMQNMPDTPERTELIYSLKNNEGTGICLGSQISQVMALAVPNKIDHYIKDKCSMHYYVRYMDDGVILSDNKQELQELREYLIGLAKELGLRFNEKKTHIVKMSKGFTFMKVKYFVTKSGKVIRTLVRSGVTRMRRKLKKFQGLVAQGLMSIEDVYASMQSWLAHSKIARSYQTRKRMLRLYDELFGGYKLTRKYRHLQNKLCIVA